MLPTLHGMHATYMLTFSKAFAWCIAKVGSVEITCIQFYADCIVA